MSGMGEDSRGGSNATGSEASKSVIDSERSGSGPPAEIAASNMDSS